MNGQDPPRDTGSSGAAGYGDVAAGQRKGAIESEYRAVFETVDDAVFVFDVERDGSEPVFRFRRNNRAHEDLTGITTAEFRGTTPLTVFGRETGSEFTDKFYECIESKGTITYETQLTTPAGDAAVRTKLTPVLHDGAVARLIGVTRELQERSQRDIDDDQTCQWFRTLFEEAPDGIIIHDAEGDILDANQTVCQELGYTREQLRSMSVPDIEVGIDEQTLIDDWQSMDFDSLHRLEVEGVHRRRDGSTYPVEVWVRTVRTATDATERFVALTRDISSQKQRERRLKRQSEFTNNLLEAFQDVVYVLDPNGNLRRWNARLEDVTGYDSEEITSMNAVEFFVESDAEAVTGAIEDAFETGETRIQLDLLTATGETIPYEFVASVFEDPDCELVMAGIGRDRSSQVEYERRIKQKHDFLERTIDSLPYPFYVLNVDDYTIKHANSRAVVDIGDTCYKVTHRREQPCDEGDGETVACPLSEVLTSGTPTTVEHVHHDDSGNERVYTVYASPIADEDGNIVQMAESTIDITERVRYEKQLEEQRDNLQILNQVVRHDIRNDMTVIHGRANLLKEHLEGDENPDLDAIIEATENAIELTKTARDLSETMLSTAEDVEPVSLGQHLETSIEKARATFDNAVITVQSAIPDVDVYGNDLLEAVFRNLIQNAIVHNDKTAPEVSISTTRSDDTVTVSIADNGPGIPDGHKKTIFGKGEKGLDSSGTGIGLYLVHHLVEQYGGTVWVEDRVVSETGSTDGEMREGSVFHVELLHAES